MSDKNDNGLGGDWLEAVVRVLQASTGDLRELAQIAGGDPRTLYIGTSLAGVDLRGQDLRGMLLTGLNRATAVIDEKTRLDPEVAAGPQTRDRGRGVAAATRSQTAKALSGALGVQLAWRKGSYFKADDGSVRTIIATSRRYHRGYQAYWYGFYESQWRFLQEADSSFLVLTGVDTGRAWAIPTSVLRPFLDEMKMTRRPNGQNYWHVVTKLVGDACILVAGDNLDLTPFEV